MVEPAGNVLIGYSPNDFLMTNFTVAPNSCPNSNLNFTQSNQYDITETIKSNIITGITLTNEGIIYLCDNHGNIYQGDIDGHIGVWITKYDNFQDTAIPPNSYSLPVNFTGITTNGNFIALCSSTPSGTNIQQGGYCYYFTEENKTLLQINGLQKWNAIALSSDNYLYAECESIYYSQFQNESFGSFVQIQISNTIIPSTPNTIFTFGADLYYINSGGSYKITHDSGNIFTNINASYNISGNHFCVNDNNVFYLKDGNIYLSENIIIINGSSANSNICDYFSINTVKDQETIVSYQTKTKNMTIYKKDIDYCNKINPQITNNTHLKDEILATTYKGLKGDANYADATKMYNLEFANRIHLGVGIAITAISIFYLSRINI